MQKEWVNIYCYKKEYIVGSGFYTTPEEAVSQVDKYVKRQYRHTINIKTGEIRAMEI